MTIEISSMERDLLYGRILLRLSGIDSVWQAICDEDFETAQMRACEFAAMLCLLLDDLGWGERSGRSVLLRSPAEVIAGVARSIPGDAEAEEADETQERQVLELSRTRNQAVRATCKRLIRGVETATAESTSRYEST
jgi:hypothetical protein